MRFAALLALSFACLADDAARLLRVDHYVPVQSAVPAIAGQTAQIYVREVVTGATTARATNPDRVVLFVHGAGTPGEVAFDTPFEDYSWMAFLARAGYDVFAMDMTGYGRSTRPLAMNDRCNLSAEQQQALFGKTCPPTYQKTMTTIASDWADIGAVVDHLRTLRKVEKVTLFGWSLGGPRAGGYTSQNPDKVARLILLAPAYRRGSSLIQPTAAPATAAFATQSKAEFFANWERQTECAGQVDPRVREAVWTDMQASDPQAATWGPGVRRAPLVSVWGWNETVVGKMATPTLIVAAALDKQALPANVRALYDDLGSTKKTYLDLGCASHNALWEKNHLVLFQASLDFLRGTLPAGVVRLGY